MTMTSTRVAAAATATAHRISLGLPKRKNCCVIEIARRWQHRSSSKSFSSLEYPLRQEKPVVTRTTAAEAASAAANDTKNDPKIVPISKEDEDHFDDAGTMSYLESVARRQHQAEWLSKDLKQSIVIETEPPSFVPPNVSRDLLVTPQIELSTLPNGVRVVSQETYGQVSTVGILSNVGSRLETPQETGVTHLLELLAFRSTQSDSSLAIAQKLQDWGGVSFCNTGREQTLFCIDVLRPSTEKAIQLLSQVLQEPLFRPQEVEECKRAIEFQTMDVMPEILLGEALQTAAYGSNQQLGQPHFCPLEALPNLTSDTCRDFWSRHAIQNPGGLVVAGAGLQHDQLLELSQQHFGSLVPKQENNIVPSKYIGGRHVVKHQHIMDNFTRIAVALETEGGWHSDDLVPACVLQTLLGGGNSFSAGGPGKGMYSRLYRQVLNRYSWTESCEAFTAFHTESGLWGISAGSEPKQAGDLARVVAGHLVELSREFVSDEELDRARNMLKCNVLTQLESRLVLFEDLGRQVLTYGHREDVETMCKKIDAVTKEDLRNLVRRAMEKPPTLAAVGPDLNHVPTTEEIHRWMGYD